jgi:hypothetical protein
MGISATWVKGSLWFCGNSLAYEMESIPFRYRNRSLPKRKVYLFLQRME